MLRKENGSYSLFVEARGKAVPNIEEGDLTPKSLASSGTAFSHTFMQFIQPALAFFNNPAPMTEPFDAACAVGHMVWNSAIYHEMDPSKDYIEEAKQKAGNIPDINALIDKLVLHKKEKFPGDKRIIGVYDIERKPDGTFSMLAEVDEPPKRVT